MIIHHKEDFSNYQVRLLKKLKYSDTFSFIPLKIINKETQKAEPCIFQTPYLFAPYGLQKTMNNKTILDLSFLNKENDRCCSQFLKNLEDIFQLKSYDELSKIINDWLADDEDEDGDATTGTERGTSDTVVKTTKEKSGFSGSLDDAFADLME